LEVITTKPRFSKNCTRDSCVDVLCSTQTRVVLPLDSLVMRPTSSVATPHPHHAGAMHTARISCPRVLSASCVTLTSATPWKHPRAL